MSSIRSIPKWLWAFIMLGRWHFLSGGFVLYGLGLAIANYMTGHIDWRIAAWGQLVVTAAQSMVHYANEYFDIETDRANLTPTMWSGGSRVLLTGGVPAWVARVTAICFGTIAVVAALLLAIFGKVGPLALAIALTATGLSWFYSAPPVRLHSRGVGELSAMVVVSVLPPLFGFYLQTGQISLLPVLAIIPLWGLQFNMLCAVAMPDAEADALAGKGTLSVRLGMVNSMRLYSGLLVLVYLLIPVLVILGLPISVGIAFGLSFPVALWIAQKVAARRWLFPKGRAEIAFLSIALLMSASLFELVAFVRLAM